MASKTDNYQPLYLYLSQCVWVCVCVSAYLQQKPLKRQSLHSTTLCNTTLATQYPIVNKLLTRKNRHLLSFLFFLFVCLFVVVVALYFSTYNFAVWRMLSCYASISMCVCVSVSLRSICISGRCCCSLRLLCLMRAAAIRVTLFRRYE